MTTTATHIRTLFLTPNRTYTVPEAAGLFGMTEDAVRCAMEAGELEGVETGEGVVLPWDEVVSFGMDVWSQEVVEEALGKDVAKVIPELLRLTSLEVRIPRIEVVALERVARRDGATVDALLARELRDFVSVHSRWLSREMPEFAEAFGWPER